MLLGHGVGGGDEVVVLDKLYIEARFLGCFHGLQRGELLAAAGDSRAHGRGKDVAAGGADIKVQVFHGSSGLFIFQELPGQQALHLHAQSLGQAGEQGDVRTALARFP